MVSAWCAGVGVGGPGSSGPDWDGFAIIGGGEFDMEVGMEMEKLDKPCAAYLQEKRTPA